MKPEHYKPIREEKPKRKGKISKRRSLMLAEAQELKPITSPQLREAYSTKTEWVRLGKGANSQIEKRRNAGKKRRRA